ncbi:MAG TPA: hypothetical protein VGE47_07840, partial [Burkholderiaceae bacterium]
LAGQLAQRGFETLRFDYSATGDSADDAPPSVPRWLEDIGCAARELRELSGAREVCALGLRLGALLAAEAQARGLPLNRVAQWDAPASGAAWLEQITELDRQHYEHKNRYLPEPLKLRAVEDELLGAPWPPELAAGLAALAPPPEIAALRLCSADLSVADEAVLLPDAAHWNDVAWMSTPWNPAASPRLVCESLEACLP